MPHNCKEHGRSGSAATTEHPDKMPEHKLTEVLLHAFFFFFTIHSLNLYIFNDHITVSLSINYAWGNCYLVHITLTQTPVWESRCKDEFLWIRNTYIQAIPATLCFWNYINLFRHSFHRILKAAKYCITNWQLSRGKCGGKWQDY